MNFCTFVSLCLQCMPSLVLHLLVCVFRQGDQEANITENSDSEVESMGEKVFNLVRQIDPTHTADITGELARFSFLPQTRGSFTFGG